MSNTEIPARMESKSKPVRLLASVAAASTALAGGLPLIPGVPTWVGAAVGLLGLCLTVGIGKYTEDSVTPWVDVAVKKTESGDMVAGPAAEQRTGAAVDVTLQNLLQE